MKELKELPEKAKLFLAAISWVRTSVGALLVVITAAYMVGEYKAKVDTLRKESNALHKAVDRLQTRYENLLEAVRLYSAECHRQVDEIRRDVYRYSKWERFKPSEGKP